RGELAREMLELRVGGPAVGARRLLGGGRRLAPAVDVDDHSARDRVGPRTKVVAVREAPVRAQGAEKRLLERVVGLGPSEPAPEEREDLSAVRLVEPLERRN